MELELIKAERLSVRYAREDEIDEIQGRGYKSTSQTAQLNLQYDKDLDRVSTSITTVTQSMNDKILRGEAYGEEADTLKHLTKKQKELTEARQRELDLIKNEMLDAFSEVGVEYSALGQANLGLIDRLQNVSDEFNVGFNIDSLGIDALSGDVESIVDDIITFNEDMTDAEKESIKELAGEAIKGRQRELALEKERQTLAERNRVADFFGVTNEQYTFNDFKDAMERLAEVIDSLDKTMEDLYYSDLNPMPFADKFESAEAKYLGLYTAAITPDSEGNYNAEAISEFQSYVNTYLGYQQDMYASSSEYIRAFNSGISKVSNIDIGAGRKKRKKSQGFS